MAYKHICDCCGKDIEATLFKYELKATLCFSSLDICRDCYDTIRKTILEKKAKIAKGID